jgi:hypothetical protein
MPREIDTASTRAPAKFSIGDIHLWNIRSWRMIVSDESYDVEKRMEISDFDDKTHREGAQVSVHLFPLPRGAKEWRAELNFYRRQKRSFLVKPAGKFHEQILALSDVPAGFEHEAFQTRDGNSRFRIVHVYRSAKQAAIVIYSLGSTGFLRSKCLQHVAGNLKIGPAHPGRMSKSTHPARSRQIKPRSLISGSDRALRADERKEIAECIKAAYGFLKVNPKATSAAAVQKAIYNAIEEIIRSRKRLTTKIETDLALNLGCLWGETVRRTLRWQWCYAKIDGTEFFAIASRNRSHVVAPMPFMMEQLRKRGSSCNNTSLLLFNMLKANSFPKAEPRSYVTIG